MTAKTLERGAVNVPGPSLSAVELAGSGKPDPGLAGAWKGHSAKGQGPANLPPLNSDGLSQQLPSPLKTSQQPLSCRDSHSQRGWQPGCFRPRQGMVVPASLKALGLPGLLGTHSLVFGGEQARTDPGGCLPSRHLYAGAGPEHELESITRK